MDFLESTKLLIGLVTGLITSGITFFTWRSKRKKAEKTSSQLLYKELEELKIKVISQVSREVNLATDNEKKRLIIEKFKLACPDCYASFIESQKTNSNAPS
jgi:Flp pilus assembly protein TadB